MLAAAAGLWARSYLALLAFEALLAVAIIYAALSLAFASQPRSASLLARRRDRRSARRSSGCSSA